MTIEEKRLSRLLKHRLLLERIEEGAFATVRQATARRQEVLTGNQLRQVELYEIGGPATGDLDTAMERGRSAYSVRLGRDIQSAGAALDAGRREEAQQRDVLLGRRRDRMAIEALIERNREAAKQASRRKQLQRDDAWAARNWLAARTQEVQP